MSLTISEIAINTTHLSGNPIWVKVTTSLVQGTNYKILLKVVSPDGVLIGTPFIDAIAPDTDDVAWFNISGLVDQAITKNFNWPLLGRINAYTDMAYDIWLYAGESYIDGSGDPQESFETVVEPFFIVKGKLPLIKLAELNDASSSWFDYFVDGERFLSLMPTTQKVSPWQPVKLWYKWPDAVSDVIDLIVTATFDDDSTQTIEQNPAVTRASLYEFDVQPEHVGFTLDNGVKKMISFTVSAEIDSVPILEIRTFEIDWDYKEKHWYLFVDNQIGGIETIWLKGRAVYAPTGERSLAGKPQPRGAGVKIPTLVVSGNSRQRKWKINSGIKLKDELAALDILLDSPEAWLAIPPASGATALSGYTLAPVIINNTEFVLNDDTQDVESIDIELLEAHS